MCPKLVFGAALAENREQNSNDHLAVALRMSSELPVILETSSWHRHTLPELLWVHSFLGLQGYLLQNCSFITSWNQLNPIFLTSEEKSNFGEKNHKWHIFLPLRFQVLASVRHKIEQFAAAEQSFPLLLAEAQQYLLARMGSPNRELPGVSTKGNKQVTCKKIRSLNGWIWEETFVYMEYYFTMFLH